MKKNLVFTICVFICCAIFGFFIYTAIEPNQNHNTELNERAEQAVKPYITKDYNNDTFTYEPISTTIDVLYDYTPSDIGDCAEEIARIEWRMEIPEFVSLDLNDELSSCREILYETLDTIENKDSVRYETGWIITHKYTMKNDLSSKTHTKYFITNMSFNDVQEVSPNRVNILLRRDEIVENAIKYRTPQQ